MCPMKSRLLRGAARKCARLSVFPTTLFRLLKPCQSGAMNEVSSATKLAEELELASGLTYAQAVDALIKATRSEASKYLHFRIKPNQGKWSLCATVCNMDAAIARQ